LRLYDDEKAGENTGYAYGYDAAGNIISDSGKGLEIAYNVLNLPRAVSGGYGRIYVQMTLGTIVTRVKS